MLGDVNRVTLIGTVSSDPESKVVNGGQHVLRFRMATIRMRGDKPFTNYHACAAFGRVADQNVRLLHKGARIYLDGELQTRSFTDEGQRRSLTEVIALQIAMLAPPSAAAHAERVVVPDDPEEKAEPKRSPLPSSHAAHAAPPERDDENGGES